MPDQPVIIPVAGHAELQLSTRSGHVTVVAEDRQDIVVESGGPRSYESDATGRIKLSSAKRGTAHLQVRCPAGSDVAVGTISGTIRLRGPLGAVRVTNVSGNVDVERAEDLDVRSISGSIEVDRCPGRCRLQTKSGSAKAGHSGETTVSTISGRIRVDEATGVRAQSVSGAIEVGLQGKGDAAVQTISGSVRVAVPKDVRPSTSLHSMSGRPRSDCLPGNDCKIRVRSLSGKIEVVPD